MGPGRLGLRGKRGAHRYEQILNSISRCWPRFSARVCGVNTFTVYIFRHRCINKVFRLSWLRRCKLISHYICNCLLEVLTVILRSFHFSSGETSRWNNTTCFDSTVHRSQLGSNSKRIVKLSPFFEFSLSDCTEKHGWRMASHISGRPHFVQRHS